MKYASLLFVLNLYFSLYAESQQPLSGHEEGKPAKRSEYAKWSIGNKFYLYGGVVADLRDVPKMEARELGDLWEFDLETKTWHKLYEAVIPIVYNSNRKREPVAGPANREGAASWTYNGELYLFGGRREKASSSYDYLNDTWIFNPVNNTWRTVNKPAAQEGTDAVPFGRRNAVTWFRNDSLVLTAGRTENSEFMLKDVWTFDCKKESWTNIIPRIDTALQSRRQQNQKLLEDTQKELYQQLMAGKMPPATYQKRMDSLQPLMLKMMTGGMDLPTESTTFNTSNFPVISDEGSFGFGVNDRLLAAGRSWKEKKLMFWELNLSQKSWRVVPGTDRSFEARGSATDCDTTAAPGFMLNYLLGPIQKNKVFQIGTRNGEAMLAAIYDFDNNCWKAFAKFWGKFGEDDGPLQGQWNIWWQNTDGNIGFTNVKMSDYWVLNTETLKWAKK